MSMYPNQEHQQITTTIYHVHESNKGIRDSSESLKHAREMYRQIRSEGIEAMITKTTTTEIIMISNDHIQGRL